MNRKEFACKVYVQACETWSDKVKLESFGTNALKWYDKTFPDRDNVPQRARETEKVLEKCGERGKFICVYCDNNPVTCCEIPRKAPMISSDRTNERGGMECDGFERNGVGLGGDNA